MRAISIIFKRELGSYLFSPLGWIIAAFYLVMCGLLFQVWAMGDKPRLSAEVLQQFFYVASGLTMVAGIALSFHLFSEERQNRTLVLLNTSPVRDVEILAGKFLAAFVFLSAMILLTFYMPMLIKIRGKVSLGEMSAGYLGLILLGAASLSIGTFASSLTRHQFVALIVGLVMLAVMVLLFQLSKVLSPPLSNVFNDLSLWNGHFGPSFMKGIINTKDIVYYLATTYFFLLLATKTMEAKRWQ